MDDVLHIVPINDLIEHQTDGFCICGPRVHPVRGEDGQLAMQIIHESLDGREQHERSGP